MRPLTTRAPAVSARPVISSSGSSPTVCPGRITRTRTAFSLATPSIRSVSYTKFLGLLGFLGLGMWFLAELAGIGYVSSVVAILIPGKILEKADWVNSWQLTWKWRVLQRARRDLTADNADDTDLRQADYWL